MQSSHPRSSAQPCLKSALFLCNLLQLVPVLVAEVMYFCCQNILFALRPFYPTLLFSSLLCSLFSLFGLFPYPLLLHSHQNVASKIRRSMPTLEKDMATTQKHMSSPFFCITSSSRPCTMELPPDVTRHHQTSHQTFQKLCNLQCFPTRRFFLEKS
jgi:hypothetical protein